MSSTSTFDRAVSAVLAVSVLAATGILIEGRLNRSPTEAGERIEFVKDWRDHSDAILRLDSTTYPVEVAVFTDFECPYCARLDSVLRDFQVAHPELITRSIIHYPLPSHRFARPAARAFQCAAEQGLGDQMSDVLYANQQSFGNVAWANLAEIATVEDIETFNNCLESSRNDHRVAAGLALAERLKVTRTPVVLVNGWLLDPGTPANVEKAILAVRAGRHPQE